MNKNNCILVKKRYVLFSIVLSFVLYLFRLVQNNNIDIAMDELGTLANASYYAGLDWSNVLSLTRYYGAGFYWIYSIFFRVFENPYVIVILIYVTNSLLVSLSAGLIYIIMVRWQKAGDNWRTAVFAAVPCAFYHIAAWSYISKEVPVFLFFWGMIYCMVNAYGNRGSDVKKYRLCSSLAAVFLVALLTVHERAIAVWITAFVIIVLFLLFFREKIVSFRFFFPVCFLGYFFAQLYKKVILHRFWGGNSILNNTNAFSGVRLWFLDKLSGWKIILDIIITNFLRLNENTYGLIAVGIGVVLIGFGYLIYRRVKRGKKIYLTRTNKIRLMIFLFGFFTSVIIIAGLAVSWGRHIYDVLGGAEIGVYYRAYTYIRYYAGFAGPMMIAVLSFLNRKRNRRGMAILGLAVFGFLLLYYFIGVHPYFYGEWGMKRVYLYNLVKNPVGIENVVISIIIIICVYLVMIAVKSRNMLPGILLFLLVLSAYDETEIGKPMVSCENAGASYEMVKNLEREGMELDEIYVSSNAATYQVMLNRYQVHLELPDDNGDAFVLSNFDIYTQALYLPEITEYYWLQLDENEFVYARGKIVKNLLKCGYALQKVGY